MDSDEEVRSERRLALEEEMSKLRCNSASPSTLSTASSGSPLVRGASGSSGSGKRPAPTSIAAAQLQCQQQQRLEFSNRLAGAAKTGAAAPASRQRVEPAAKKSAKPEAGKSLGYKLAKTMASRAYRFNEFWSVNKLRYMNLACLLMTLICLAAILLLAGNNGARAPSRPRPGDELAEAVAGSSQPLVAKQELGEHAERDYGDLERAEAGETLASRPREPKFRRKISAELAEREVEETTAGAGQQPNDMLDPINRLESLVDPIMSQLFDIELGGLHNLLRQRANLSRPLVRRTKSGATITISSAGLGPNDTAPANSSEASPLPALLERLLRPAGLRGDANSSNVAATATITIGAEPMFAAASPVATIRMSTSGGLGPFSPLEALFGPSMLPPPPPPPFMSRHRRLFMEPHQHLGPARFGMGGPFGGPASVWGPPLAPPGLLGMMMMRAQQEDQQEEPQFPQRSPMSQPSLFEWAASNNNKTQDNQPTSQSNSTTGGKQAGSGPQEQQQEGSENELEVVAPGRRLQSLYSRSRPASPHGGSMLIFSSGPVDAGDLPPFAGPFAGLLPPPPAQMMLVGGEGSRAGDGLMSPLIKSLLGSVMGDLAPGAELVPAAAAAAAGHGNKSSTNSSASDKQARASSRAPAWMSPGPAPASSDPDDDWAPLGTEASAWDEKEQQGKQLRARHRSQQDLGEELDDGQAGLLAGLQLEQAPSESSQPITARHFRPVPAGAKSQSLSRADDDEPVGLSRHLGRSPGGRLAAAFLRPPAQQNDRRLDDDSMGLVGPDMPPFGFIGKLLSDLSSAGHRHTTGSSRSRSLDLDDLDEGDSSQSEQSQEPAAALLRPLRVASARIRMMRPTFMNHASEPTPFLPALFGLGSAEPNGGDEKESAREEQQPSSSRLDDNALSSAEDRIRLTLNQIYQQSPEPQQQQPQQQQQKAFVLGPIPRGANIPIPLVQPQQQQQQQQQPVKKSEPAKDGNPFTSPSSPLFGFPANSQAPLPAPAGEPQKAAAAAAKLVVVGPAPSPQNQQTPGASRQQRSFTYHSNNEIAAPFHAASQQKQPANQQQQQHHHNHQQQQQQAETQARSRFVAPLTQPPPPPSFMAAAGIMGRRLDDINEAGVHPHGRGSY